MITITQIKKMSKEELQILADELQDKLCNIDYRINGIEYDYYANQLNLVEQRLIYKEI